MSLLTTSALELELAEHIATDPRSVMAALDIGSNSFHMVLARRVRNDFQILGRYKEQVQLAAGLDADFKLDEAAMVRGMACLDDFSRYLTAYPG